MLGGGASGRLLRAAAGHRTAGSVRILHAPPLYPCTDESASREVQQEIVDRHGVYIPMTRVIMTSDESDQEWWDEVTALGWVRMDHEKEQTVERYGRWCVKSSSSPL